MYIVYLLDIKIERQRADSKYGLLKGTIPMNHNGGDLNLLLMKYTDKHYFFFDEIPIDGGSSPYIK